MKNGRLKVLLVPSNYWSGIGSMARHLASSVKGVDYYFFTSAAIKNHPKEFMRLVSSVDIVHWLANLSTVKLPPEIDIRKFPAPNIATVHHVDEEVIGYREKEEATKISAASISNVIQVVSAEWLNYVQSRTKTPVFLAHQAIDPSEFARNRNKKRPRNPFIIGTFGNAKEFKDRKRVDVLLGALSILKGRNYDFELIVQGQYWNELQNPFIQQNIKVKNLGFLSNKKAQQSYRFIDLYVCSSDVEGGPLPVLESLASGVPVVSTRVGVAIEALSLGGGILVNKGSPKDLANAIGLIMDDSSLYRRLSQETIQVAENYSWKKLGSEYLTMYQYALSTKEPMAVKKPLLEFPRIQREMQMSMQNIRESYFTKLIFRTKHLFGETCRKIH